MPGFAAVDVLRAMGLFQVCDGSFDGAFLVFGQLVAELAQLLLGLEYRLSA